MRQKKLKIDYLKKEKLSPYIIDLKPKEKKEINLLPLTKIFKKITIFLLIIMFLFLNFIFIHHTYFQISNLKRGLLSERDFLLESFFEGLIALEKSDFNSAEEKLTLVEERLSKRIKEIDQTNLLVKTLLLFQPAKTEFALLNLFRDSARIGIFLAKTAKELPFLLEIKKREETVVGEKQILPADLLAIDFLEKIDFLRQKNSQLLPLINRIEKNLTRVEITYIPSAFRFSFELVKKEMPILRKGFDDFNLILENLRNIVGERSLKRYLILFQNNNEIRPTGGFLGTYAQIDFEDGKIKRFEMPGGGTYDLAGQLTVRVAPPKPFLIAYPKWQFHDANWFPDWPTSARKLIWFYERSGGPTVDGVIAINAEILPEVLRVIGEIPLPTYEKTLNSENSILEIQKSIEQARRKEEKKPKQILVDLTPIILERIFSLEPSKLFALLQVFNQGLQEKKILFYFSDESLQEFFQKKNLTGEIKESPLDYLMVNVANVNGAKTEGKISQKIFYKAEIQEDGSILSTLTIKRKHEGVIGEPFFGRKDLSWLRVYLPKGSIFLGTKSVPKNLIPSAGEIELDKDVVNIEKEIAIDKFSGLRITEEFNKTCFGNFLEVSPAEEEEISFKYLLPFKLDLNKEATPYSLLIQKQPGRESNFEAEIILPKERKITWAHPWEEINQQDHSVKILSTIDRDKIFAFVIE